MHINRTQLVLIFINILHQIVNFYLSLHNKMGYPNVFPVVITLLFLMSMHANEAGRILLGGEQELMNKNSINQRAIVGGHNMVSLRGMLPRGPVTPSSPNPGTHIPASTINERAFVGYYLDSIQGSLQKGLVSPSAPNPDTYIPVSTISQRAFVSHNMDSIQGSLAKGPTPPSAPNPVTHNSHLTVSQRAFKGYNVASLQGSLPRGPVPPSGPNPPTHHPASTIGQKAFGGHNMALFKSSLKKGLVPPSGPNPPTHIPSSSTTNSGTHNIPASTISGRAFRGHNMALFKSSLARGTVPPSAPNPPTHNPAISGRAFVGHLQESLQKGPVTPSKPNPGTQIP